MTSLPEMRTPTPPPLRMALPFISAAAFVFVLPMLLWGYAPTHDFTFHVGNWMEFARQWHQGIVLPRWASHANYGFGEPRFIFYPPLANFVGAALSFLMPWKAVPGAFVFVTLMLAGIATFIAAREWVPERYAVLSAIAYVINPYQVMLVYKRMAAAEMLAAALFPLFLLFALRTADRDRRAVVPLAVVYAAIWLSNAPSAVMASYVAALLLALSAWKQRSLQSIWFGAVGLAAGISIAAFYIAPAAWEQRWVNISLALTLPHNRPENNFIRLFPPRLPGGIGSIITVGVVNLILAVALCWLAYRRRRSLPSASWPWTLVVLFAGVFTLPISFPLWKLLPKMIFVQLPWRWLFVVNAACALLLGALLPVLARRTRIAVAAIPVFMFLVLLGVYASKGRPGRVAELQSRMEREGGVWAEAQYLPEGGVRGPAVSKGEVVENGGSGAVSVLQSTAEQITLQTDIPRPDRAVMNVAWFPAWHARVDGKDVPVRNSAGQIGVDVPAGKSTVSITFARTSDRTLGGVVSMLAIAVVAIFCTLQRSKQAATPQQVLKQRA